MALYFEYKFIKNRLARSKAKKQSQTHNHPVIGDHNAPSPATHDTTMNNADLSQTLAQLKHLGVATELEGLLALMTPGKKGGSPPQIDISLFAHSDNVPSQSMEDIDMNHDKEAVRISKLALSEAESEREETSKDAGLWALEMNDILVQIQVAQRSESSDETSLAKDLKVFHRRLRECLTPFENSLNRLVEYDARIQQLKEA